MPGTDNLAERTAELSAAKRALIEKRLRGGRSETKRPQVIPRRSEWEPAVLSFAQQRLWFIDQLERGSSFYNTPVAVRLSGVLQQEVLERTLSEIVRRHETLRTHFAEVDGKPVQIISPAAPLPLPVTDLSGLAEAEREAAAARLASEEAAIPFDLGTGPLIRARLLRLSAEEHVVLLTMHHIVTDGWSIGVFIKEVAALYEAYTRGRTSPLAELEFQYADYAAWQRGWLQGEALEAQLGYWREQLGGRLPVLELPTDRPRPAVQSFRGARCTLRLSPQLVESLTSHGRREGVTLFMTLLAAFQTLLHRYTQQDDVLVGTAIANRNRAETEQLIGFFANTLVMRTSLAGDPTFIEVLHRVREVSLGAYAHQDLPFEKLVEELQPERSLSHLPLFQTMFILQNAPLQRLELDSLKLSPLEVDNWSAKLDLLLTMTEDPQGLTGTWIYNTDLFDATTVERMMVHFQTLLEGVAADPHQKISTMPLLSQEEWRQSVVEWNSATSEQGGSRCMQELFEEHAERTPDAVAVVYEDEELSYDELNRRANRLAHYLKRLGAGPQVLVGICVERSVEMIVGLLGILKAGATYVPLDPTYPSERLAFMVEDSRTPILLTQERLVPILPAQGTRVVCLDADWHLIAQEGAENPSTAVTPENLAYVIYTSGSTGRPKGVMVCHRAVVHLFHALQPRIGFDARDVWTVVHSYAFDFSVWEIWGALLHGGRLVIVPSWVARTPSAFYELLRTQRVTVLNQTPSAFAQLIGEREESDWDSGELALKVVVLGGDTLPQDLLTKMGRGSTPVWNFYGPTEATVWTTLQELDRADGVVSVGRPMADTQVYILDRRQQPVPVGVAGELYIGGDNLSHGYLNRPTLTAEKFITHPFSGKAGARLYRTGDLTRYLSDGRIEFLGRIDHQVKIRGFRIELGEVEAALTTHPSVDECVVVAREDMAGDKRLVAYVVCGAEEEDGAARWREHLRERLPEYMLPSVFVRLASLPLTANGKVDRRSLPAPEADGAANREDLRGARTPVEEILAGLWAEVLHVREVGIDENFFELGGHSLLATQLMSRVREAFGVEVALRRLFEEPTVAGLAAHVEQLLKSTEALAAPPMVRASRDGHLPLSFAQQRLWFVNQLEQANPFYNIPVAVRLSGTLDIGALERTLTEVVRRHEALRTHVAEVEGEPVQVISPAAPVPLPLTDLGGLEEAGREAEARRLTTAEAGTPFDLKRAPLVRARLLRLSAAEHVVLLTMHHMVSDGWSFGVLIGEVAALYTAFAQGRPSPLAELELQYADYAAWQREWLRDEALEEQLSYWRGQLGGRLPVLELPTDRPRPAVQTYRGSHRTYTLRDEVAAGVRELSRREGVTLFMTLLAAFQVLLHRYSGQDDILVGCFIAGRNRKEVEPLVGCFVNTLVLRTDLGGNPGFRELLRRVREVTLSAYAHQDVPFEKLVEELQPARSLSHTPLFQVAFGMQNTPAERVELPQLAMSNVSGEDGTAKFDLTLTAAETEGGLRVSWNYNTEMFDEETVGRMARHYERIVEAVAAVPELRVPEIELLGADERELLLVGWNQTKCDYPHDRCLHQLIEAQAALAPERVAVVYEDAGLSYGELNARANQLARHLRALGVGPDSPVGVMMERTAEMLVALLGVLKAGGAYVPLDPAYPSDRLAFMLEDSRAGVLLTERHLAGALPGVRARVIALDAEWEPISRLGAGNPENVTSPSNLAYVIYTSGSTGRPKGVQVSHGALVNFLSSMTGRPGLSRSDILLSVTSLSFDIAGLELFLPLTVGARVALATRAEAADGLALARRLSDSRVTVMQATPSTWRLLLDAGWGGDERLTALCGGEAMASALAAELTARTSSLWNMYGPTETTIWSAVAEVAAGAAEVTIGGGIANTQLYVLDARLGPAPKGVAGELYIGGDGLARGYLNRPGLTAEKFVPDPHAVEAGARMYRTGDLVRRLADGRIRFLGRIDHQVKVRGYRIELGEIEAALAAHASVGECVVVAREDDRGDKRLVAYLVGASDAQPATAGELREHLRRRLPEYMVPWVFVQLASMPLTPNGKVDRKALPDPELDDEAGRGGRRQPRTPVEEVLAGIFAEVLRVREVGVDESFFELRGHSLLATQLMSRVREAFSVEVALRKLFEGPTVAELAQHIEELLRGGKAIPAPPVVRAPRDGRLPLSFAQQRLWFIDQLEPANPFYNIPVAVRLSGRLNVEALGRTLTEVVRRHEVLRTHFTEVEGEPVQVISPAGALELPLTDLGGMNDGARESEARRLTAQEGRTPFDLGRGPLIRARLLRLSEEEHVALLTMHHIVADGWSFGVLVRELAALYAAYVRGEASPLPELELQYAGYAAWQRGWLRGEVLEEQLSYWRKQLGGKLPVLELPSDRPRPAVQTFRGSHATSTLRPEVAEGVRELSRREGVTPFMTLLAVFQVLLHRYTNQDDLVVGSAIAGRNRKEVEPLIGFFINTLVLRTDLGGNPGFRELLRRVREVTLSAYAHQDVPFEKLVEELQPTRSLSHTPLFQVAFGMQNTPAAELELPGLRLTSVAAANEVGRFDLTVWVAETAAGMQVRWSYNTDLFDEATIGRMQRHYEELLGSVVAEPGARLSALNMLTAAEQAQQLTKENELAKSVYKKFMSANLKPVSLPKTAP
ncbi:MAG: amino acid adenylation domain-containing protein [Pyrinomonadaceae bacterium]